MLRQNRLENVCSQQILGYFRASAKPTLSVWHHEVLQWIRLWAYSTTLGSPENTTEAYLVSTSLKKQKFMAFNSRLDVLEREKRSAESKVETVKAETETKLSKLRAEKDVLEEK